MGMSKTSTAEPPDTLSGSAGTVSSFLEFTNTIPATPHFSKRFAFSTNGQAPRATIATFPLSCAAFSTATCAYLGTAANAVTELSATHDPNSARAKSTSVVPPITSPGPVPVLTAAAASAAVAKAATPPPPPPPLAVAVADVCCLGMRRRRRWCFLERSRAFRVDLPRRTVTVPPSGGQFSNLSTVAKVHSPDDRCTSTLPPACMPFSGGPCRDL
mmetsp:Transcript_3112/g.6238  ORF Transcript_3112/g.6238 Transcript_3112/m.6238 type:complete len:215 (-) Transcript_3112:140-784(-)